MSVLPSRVLLLIENSDCDMLLSALHREPFEPDGRGIRNKLFDTASWEHGLLEFSHYDAN